MYSPLQGSTKNAYRLQPTIWLLIKYPLQLHGKLLHLMESYSGHGNSLIMKLPRSNFQCLQRGRMSDSLPRNRKTNVNRTQSVTLIQLASALQQTHDLSCVYTSTSSTSETLLLSCVNFSVSNSHCSLLLSSCIAKIFL